MSEALAPGEWGKIDVRPTGREGRTGYRARCYVRDLDGVRHYPERTRRTEKMARTALLEQVAELVRPAPKPEKAKKAKAGDRPFGTYLDEWLENIRDEEDLAADTLREYRRTAKQIRSAPVLNGQGKPVGGTLGEVPMKSLEYDVLRAHLRSIAEDHRVKAKKHKTVLKQAVDVAMSHGALKGTNPVSLVRGVKKPGKKRVAAPTIEETLLLRAKAEAWHAEKVADYTRGSRPTGILLVLIDVIMATGLRIGEVLALRWHDIDLVNGTVTVRGTIIEGAIRQSKPKSKSGYRTLRLPPFAITRLEKHLESQANKPTQKVFPSRADTWRSKHNTHTMLRLFRADEGLSDDMTFRALRKTVATIVKEERGARATMLQLGHSNESIQDAYVNRPIEADDVAELLQEAFGNK